jgi:pimeloyl-ACP methyl ester carboxylesterase
VGCFLLPLYLEAFSAHLQPFEWVEEPVSLFRAAARYRATLLWSPNFTFSFRARLGREVEPHHLLGEETIERQAALLRDQAEPGSGALVALRSGGSNLPLYLVHPAGGSPFSYLALARRLGPGQPVYAFRDPHLSDDRSRFASLEQMAEAYLAELEAFDPKGPYALGGWSMGGLVAFEMACRLAARGREVAMLLMLDTFEPEGLLRRAWYGAGQALARAVLHTFGVGRIFSLLHDGRRMSAAERLFHIAYTDYECSRPRVIAATFPGLCDEAALRRLPAAERWEHVYCRLREEKLVAAVPGRTAAGLRREQRMFRVHHEINSRYRPRSVYPGQITFFTIRGSRVAEGWQRYSARPLAVHEFDLKGTPELPDAHLAMMQDANVALYAETLRSLLGGD